MASLMAKSALSLGGRRSFSLSVVASCKGKGKGTKMSDPTFHATGLEKFELLAAEAGNDNPFDTYLIRPESGEGDSLRSPILIPSLESSRIVGCSCESDYKDVVWFNLQEGDPQQCDCGVYFKLFKHDPLLAKNNSSSSK